MRYHIGVMGFRLGKSFYNMNIVDGLKLEGQKVEIPGCSRDDLPEFFKEMGYKAGVEIGVYKGDYSATLCKAGLKIYSMDPWLVYPDFYGMIGNQEKQERNYIRAKSRLSHYDCTIIRKTSMEAVKDFEDGSLDFVYIDGNHDFKHITEDIWEWSKKVRKGGIISGHDYRNQNAEVLPVHVRYVLDAYTQAVDIPKWYILGREREIDRDRSWFWINE